MQFMQNLVVGTLTAIAMGSASHAATVAENVNTVGALPVQFYSGPNRIMANLYLPEKFKSGERYPGIVVSHPWGGVKEQTAGLYAQQLAKKGFVTLAYDAAHYGESEGMPRDFEDPAVRVENIRSAVGFLANRPEVRPESIGTLGICAGGGYTLHEAQTDWRVKAVATVVAYDIGGAARDGITGSEVTPEAHTQLMNALSAELNAVAGGKPHTTGLLLPDPKNWTDKTDEFTKEAYSYYRTPRGAHPNAKNTYVFSSFALHQGYYPLDHMDLISPRPVLLIAGEKAETLKFSQEAYERAKEPKTLDVIKDATHFAFYDQPEAFGVALERLTAFFNDNLNK